MIDGSLVQSTAKKAASPPSASETTQNRRRDNVTTSRETYAPERQRQLLNDLVKTIKDRIPSAADPGTRSSWLAGIPATFFQRSESNLDTDLLGIVYQLAKLGRLTEGSWSLSVFINNVLESVKGYAVTTTLEKLRDDLEQEFDQSERTGAGTTKSIHAADKRGQKTQTSKLLTGSRDWSISQIAEALAESKRLATAFQTEADNSERQLADIKDFLQSALAQTAAIDRRIKKYEESNQCIEPHLKSASLLDHYIELCGEYRWAEKCPTKEDLAAIRHHVEKVTRGDDDEFLRWIKDLMIGDEATRVFAHNSLHDQVKKRTETLLRQLTADDDPQRLHKNLQNLSASVHELLGSWTDAQRILRDDITARLVKLREDLAAYRGPGTPALSNGKER